MEDVDGPLIAKIVYEEIFKGNSDTIDPDSVPYALDAAIQKLRALDPSSPARWATYIHLGM